MGEYTKSLQLYKADVVENANDTFNIETMLNDNWDKIDEKLEKLPIQNGGLYINSKTTEEDKAEAVEAIKEIGLSASDVGALPIRTVTSGSFNDIKETGAYYVSNAVTDKPTNTGGLFIVYFYNSEIAHGYYSPNNRNGECPYMCLYNGSWVFRGLLPLDGSVPMSGAIKSASSAFVFSTVDNSYKMFCGGDKYNTGARLVLYGRNSSESAGSFVLFTSTTGENGATGIALRGYSDGTLKWEDSRLFGEHNKPSGSYTGNGSATSRTIETGGLGNVAAVWSANGAVLLINVGGIAKSATNLYALSGSESNCANGKIILTTTSIFLNENGTKYVYQVL